MGCHFFDAAGAARCPDTNGVHLDAEAHGQLGAAMAERVKAIFA